MVDARLTPPPASLPQQHRQLGEIERDPPRLIAPSFDLLFM
jgi:hypothetical protein